MSAFSAQQCPFFFYGLAFLWLATVAHFLRRQPGERLPWFWLACFGLIHGLGLWLQMLAPRQAATWPWQTGHLALTAGAIGALCEFGRRALPRLSGRACRAWIYLPLLCLAAIGGLLDGLPGLEAMSWYAAGVPGAVLAGLCLVRASQGTAKDQRRRLQTAGLALLAYAPAAGLLVPAAAFAPARWLNQATFSAGVGFPVQFVCAACILLAATGLWQYGRGCQASAPRPRVFRYWLLPATVVLLIAIGWAGSYGRSNTVDAQAQPVVAQAADAAAEETDGSSPSELEGQATTRESLAMRRLRSSAPLLLFNLGLGVFLAACWALAQRFSRW